jgi:hypothetical protein
MSRLTAPQPAHHDTLSIRLQMPQTHAHTPAPQTRTALAEAQQRDGPGAVGRAQVRQDDVQDVRLVLAKGAIRSPGLRARREAQQRHVRARRLRVAQLHASKQRDEASQSVLEDRIRRCDECVPARTPLRRRPGAPPSARSPRRAAAAAAASRRRARHGRALPRQSQAATARPPQPHPAHTTESQQW